jgi:hypothetical protein
MKTHRMKSHPRFKARGVLLALVAVFVMSAVATAAASAAKPEFKPVPTKKKFTISGGVSEWGSGEGDIECAKTSATGEIDSAQTVGNVVVVYSGCTSTGSGGANCPVNSVGAKAGEIVTGSLDGELGTVATSQAASGVGLRFKPASTKTWFTEQKNECTPELAFKGQLAAEVSIIGKKQTTNKLVLEPGASGEKIKEITLDSGVTEKPELEAFGAIVAIKATEELKFEEAVEVT